MRNQRKRTQRTADPLPATSRTSRADAKAVGRILEPEDWDNDKENSAVYRETRQRRARVYPASLDG